MSRKKDKPKQWKARITFVPIPSDRRNQAYRDWARLFIKARRKRGIKAKGKNLVK